MTWSGLDTVTALCKSFVSIFVLLSLTAEQLIPATNTWGTEERTVGGAERAIRTIIKTHAVTAGDREGVRGAGGGGVVGSYPSRRQNRGKIFRSGTQGVWPEAVHFPGTKPPW